MNFLEGLLWLTLNIYHEARGESEIGKKAVAHVTLNRAIQQQKTIAAIVTAPHQFSWISQRSNYFPEDEKALKKCFQVALKTLNERDFTRGATFYHRHTIRPYWAKKMTYIARYGHHKFYRNK